MDKDNDEKTKKDMKGNREIEAEEKCQREREIRRKGE